MAAYFISDVSPKDTDAFEGYRLRAADSIARHGGRYLVRGGNVETIEGNWAPRAIVIVEFATVERARAWYRSAEYAQALTLRDRALDRNLILVEGVPVDT